MQRGDKQVEESSGGFWPGAEQTDGEKSVEDKMRFGWNRSERQERLVIYSSTSFLLHHTVRNCCKFTLKSQQCNPV